MRTYINSGFMIMLHRKVELYAHGPGLMLHSPSAATAFQSGKDYSSSLGPGDGELGEALATGRVVLLSTGSPGLDYTVILADSNSPLELSDKPLARAQFSLVVTDGCLLVRDGYVTTRWGDEAYATERIVLADGFYLVDARWMPSFRNGHMLIHLLLGRTDDPPKNCLGWVDLEFIAS